MKGIVHPFTGALHEQDGDGNIRVTLGDQVGIFGTDTGTPPARRTIGA